MSRPNPTDISLATFLALLGSVCLVCFVGLDEETPFGVEMGLLVPACMAVGVLDYFGSWDSDGGASVEG